MPGTMCIKIFRENVISVLHYRAACEPALGVIRLGGVEAESEGLNVSVAAS
jgi:hypothetical protein